MSTTLKFYLTTWNVNKSDPPDDFGHLLGLNKQELPDLYAIGLQELKSDTTTSVSDVLDDPWTKAISSTLCQRGYVRTETARGKTTSLQLFTKKDLQTGEIREESFEGASCQESVCIQVKIHGTDFVFLSSHMSAIQEEYNLKVQHYQQVSGRLRTDEPQPQKCFFWMGDLGFPINESNSYICRKLGQRKHQQLLRSDQISLMRTKRGGLFSTFEEHEVQFDPTCNFIIGTNEYDKSERICWRDRILWKTPSFVLLFDKYYAAVTEYQICNHKPVVASFTVMIEENAMLGSQNSGGPSASSYRHRDRSRDRSPHPSNTSARSDRRRDNVRGRSNRT